MGQGQKCPEGNPDTSHRPAHSGRAIPTAGIGLSSAWRGTDGDDFSLLQIVFPTQGPAASQELSALEPQGHLEGAQRGRESGALGWASAAELGWAPGMEGAAGKWAALQRDSSAQEQLLCKGQQG